MVRLRDAGYCNLKLFLIYCVIYGHLIESRIHDEGIWLVQYRIIYMFHMPLFVFLSGLFLNSAEDCRRQIRRMLSTYLLFQMAAVVCGNITGLFIVHVDTPFWIFWYLLSYCFWAAFGYVWFRVGKSKWKWFILIILILLGILAGYVPWLDRSWSGSRTIVFFPYFFAGLICRPDIRWQKYRCFGIIALVSAICGMLFQGKWIPVSFLYQATPYGAAGNGPALRIFCYCMAGLMGFFGLTIVSGKRFPFTKAGANTMVAYLAHGPVVLYLRQLYLPWVIYPFLPAVILFSVFKISQWNSTFYGIVSTGDSIERRGRDAGFPKDI